jgi:hypothetical protein
MPATSVLLNNLQIIRLPGDQIHLPVPFFQFMNIAEQPGSSLPVNEDGKAHQLQALAQDVIQCQLHT